MAKSTQLKYAIWFYLAFNWWAVAYATEITTQRTGIEQLPLDGIFRVLWLSLSGGLGATLVKLAKGPVLRLPVEVAKDAVCSVLAGMLMYFFFNYYKGERGDMWLQAGLILVAGYGGSKFLDVALNNGLSVFSSYIQRILGIKPKDDTVP